MEKYSKNFIKNGNRFILKRQYGFGLIIVIGLSAMAFAGLVSDNHIMTWIFGSIAFLCMISIFTERFEINIDEQVMIIKRGLIKPADRISINDELHFELSSLVYIFIPVNVSLCARYISQEEEKVSIVAQGFTNHSMQSVLNDIEEIITLYVNKGKI